MEITKTQDTQQKDMKENIQNTVPENSNNENASTNHDKIGKGSTDSVNYVLLVCIIGVTLGIALEIINVQNRITKVARRKYWAYTANDRNGLMKHIILTLERVGFENSSNTISWDLLWAHRYPFRALYPTLNTLKPHQKVNHIPGIGFIVNKVSLATTDSEYIPKAFELPKSKDDFLKYASNNKNLQFLQKHNKHRGVYLKNVSEIDYGGESFVQEFMPKPFLVDGHKFDIGVYVVVTSVKPLRLYWYKGDVLFRYCPAKYYPLDLKNLDKYVIRDDYLPTWKVPSLISPYSNLGLSMKDSFDMYAEAKGKNTTKMWEDIQKAIVDIFLKKVHHLVNGVKNYTSQDNFFEMMRVDLIVDEDLKVYLIEANMSPNLSSAHFPQNQLLYEQILYSLFSITGIANEIVNSDQATKDMVSSQKNIAVWAKECSTTCNDHCELQVCKLCQMCIDRKLKHSLLRAHREFLHRADFRRLFPPPMTPGSQPDEDKIKNLTEFDRLQYLWYQGKCNIDITWCN